MIQTVVRYPELIGTLAEVRCMNRNAPILIVEDNKSDAMILEAICDRLFIPHDTVSDGFAAIEKLTESNYSLMILDIQMPHISGIDLLKRVRRMQSTGDMPIIISSARNQSHDVELALRNGANDYMVKPIDPLIVTQKLSNHVETKNEKWFEYDIDDAQSMGEASVLNSARIRSISEVSATLWSQRAASPGETIAIQSQFFDAGGAAVFCSVKDCRQVDGGYIVCVTFSGVSEAIRKNIRQRCRTLWATKGSNAGG